MSHGHSRFPLSRRLTIIYSAIIVGVLLLMTLLLFLEFSIIDSRDSQRIVKSSAIDIAVYVKSLDKVDASAFIDESAFKGLKLNYSIYFNVFDEYMNNIYTNKVDLPPLETQPLDKVLVLHDKDLNSDIAIIYTNAKIDGNAGTYYLQVAKSTGYYREYMRILGRILFFTSIAGIAICLISARYLSNNILRPIRDISAIAQKINTKNLNKRFRIFGRDGELQNLSRTFNSLMERLQNDFEKQKRFVSDASHELRTPLSVIRMQIDMLNRWGKDDPEILSKSLGVLKSETDNMSKLVENLLFLARSDSSELVLNKETFTITALLKEVAEETRLIHTGYSISYDCGEHDVTTADYDAVKQVLRILIDNSVKFSPPPGEIILTGVKDDKGALIAVSDKGCGIPEKNLPYIFDRFYRIDESRVRTSGGAGLGLAIAKNIVESHGGTISAASRQGEGTKIEIFIPDCDA